MDFLDYQRGTSETAIYPGAGTQSLPAVSYTILGLVGEAGEIANKFKKVLRDGRVDILKDLPDELGDVLWYMARLAEELGTTLDDVAAHNLKKLQSRKERNVLSGSGDNR